MIRLLVAFGLLLSSAPFFATAASASTTAERIDQAGWNARKRQVTLPNGIRLAYVELGDQQGTPLLLLHGYTDSSRVWSILAPWLQDHRILIPDQRGHGASEAPSCCYAMADLAEDARLFLEAMEVEKAAVAGHSMGSMVAQVLAAEHPEQVSRLVLIGSTALVPVRRTDWMWNEIMALSEPIATNTEFLRQWGPASSPTPVDPVFADYYEPEIAATPPHVWRSVLRDLLDVPVGRFAEDIQAPVLILSGGRDALFPAEHHQSLVEAFPNSEAHVFAELGHNLVLEQPERVGPVLAEFLRRR